MWRVSSQTGFVAVIQHGSGEKDTELKGCEKPSLENCVCCETRMGWSGGKSSRTLASVFMISCLPSNLLLLIHLSQGSEARKLKQSTVVDSSKFSVAM